MVNEIDYNKVHRDFVTRLTSALEEGDTGERERILQEWEESPVANLNDILLNMSEKFTTAIERVRLGEKQPNLSKCVMGVIAELQDIGYGDDANSTTKTASQCLVDYGILERKRVELLTAKGAYEKASRDYQVSAYELGINLAIKLLTPMSGEPQDPLQWHLTGEDMVQLCQRLNAIDIGKGGEEALSPDFSLGTLRKYQAMKLIPKPIRLGRESYYSFLTLLRVHAIQHFKREGYKLEDIKGHMNQSIKTTLEFYEDKYIGDRTPLEHVYVAMMNLTNPGAEELFKNYAELLKEHSAHYNSALFN